MDGLINEYNQTSSQACVTQIQTSWSALRLMQANFPFINYWSRDPQRSGRLLGLASPPPANCGSWRVLNYWFTGNCATYSGITLSEHKSPCTWVLSASYRRLSYQITHQVRSPCHHSNSSVFPNNRGFSPILFWTSSKRSITPSPTGVILISWIHIDYLPVVCVYRNSPGSPTNTFVTKVNVSFVI